MSFLFLQDIFVFEMRVKLITCSVSVPILF